MEHYLYLISNAQNLYEGFDISWNILHKYDVVYNKLNKSRMGKLKGILYYIYKIIISNDSEYQRIIRFFLENNAG